MIIVFNFFAIIKLPRTGVPKRTTNTHTVIYFCSIVGFIYNVLCIYSILKKKISCVKKVSRHKTDNKL